MNDDDATPASKSWLPVIRSPPVSATKSLVNPNVAPQKVISEHFPMIGFSTAKFKSPIRDPERLEYLFNPGLSQMHRESKSLFHLQTPEYFVEREEQNRYVEKDPFNPNFKWGDMDYSEMKPTAKSLEYDEIHDDDIEYLILRGMEAELFPQSGNYLHNVEYNAALAPIRVRQKSEWLYRPDNLKEIHEVKEALLAKLARLKKMSKQEMKTMLHYFKRHPQEFLFQDKYDRLYDKKEHKVKIKNKRLGITTNPTGESTNRTEDNNDSRSNGEPELTEEQMLNFKGNRNFMSSLMLDKTVNNTTNDNNNTTIKPISKIANGDVPPKLWRDPANKKPKVVVPKFIPVGRREARKRLRIYLFSMVMFHFIKKTVVKPEHLFKNRVLGMQKLQEEIVSNTAKLGKIIWDLVKKPLEAICKDKENYNLDPYKTQDLSKRVTLVGKKIGAMLYPIHERYPLFATEEFMNFYKDLTRNKAHLPNMCFSQFELDRLAFSKTGRLINMTLERTEMIVGCLVVVRIFIFKIILRAHFHLKISLTDHLRQNLLVVASILYDIAMDYFRELNSPIPNNDGHIENDLKPVPEERMVPEVLLEYPPEVFKPNPKQVINGMLDANDTFEFIKRGSNYYPGIRQVVREWIQFMPHELLKGKHFN
jgi:hypothetical protein